MTKTIVMFGDSITHLGSFEVPAKRHWPVLVEKMLRRDGFDARVVNAGFNGHTTEDALARIDRDVLALYPAATFVEFGFNDGHEKTAPGVPRVSRDDFAKNLRRIAELIPHVTHGKVVLIVNHPTAASTGKPGKKVDPKSYNAIIRRVAKELDLPVLDLEREFPEPGRPLAELLTEDGVHISTKGAARYAELVYRCIRENRLAE